jgi:hypothetical protein
MCTARRLPVAVRELRRAARALRLNCVSPFSRREISFGGPTDSLPGERGHVAGTDRPDLPFLMLSRPGSESSSAHGPSVRALCGGKAPLSCASETGWSRGDTR